MRHRINDHLRDSSGFSLLEILIIPAVFSIVLGSVAEILVSQMSLTFLER